MSWDFASRELAEQGEALLRAEEQGPFVAALVELAGGGYIIRVGQPAVIDRGRTSRLPDVVQIGPWGPGGYHQAAQRFNHLIDHDLA